MEFNNKVTMSIDDWRKYENDEDISLALGKVTFLSDKPNSHKHIYSIDVIKEYAPTYLGKFVVAEYNKYTDDVTTHTNNQTIVGYIPTTQEVQYEQKEDGYWYASVDVVISKIYAPDIYNLFKNNNYRSVSVEQLVGFTDDTVGLRDGEDEKVIVGFEGVGITILGMSYNPSIQGANIQLTKMSEDSIQNIENEYIKYSQKESNVDTNISEKILAKLDVIERKLDKEASMAELEKDKEIAMSEEDAKEEVCNAECTSEDEQNNTEEVEKNSDCETEAEVIETDACKESAEAETCAEEVTCEEMATMSELESKLEIANAKIVEYESEIKELREFKIKTEMAQKESIVSDTLSTVKEYVDVETYEDFAKRATECSYENINGWKNEVLATITNKALAKMSELTSKEDGIVDLGMPSEETKKESIFD